MSEPEMCLWKIKDVYFDTEEELKKHCESEGLSADDSCRIEYIRSFAGRTDVIRKTDAQSRSLYLKAIDEDGYGIYNRERSNREQSFAWEFSEGSIKELYEPFKKRGIVFEDDVYGNIYEKEQKFLKMCIDYVSLNSGNRVGASSSK